MNSMKLVLFNESFKDATVTIDLSILVTKINIWSYLNKCKKFRGMSTRYLNDKYILKLKSTMIVSTENVHTHKKKIVA